MKFYVANCSRQEWVLNYRLLEVRAPIVQPIPAGGQVLVPADLSTPQIENLLAQLRGLGLLLVEEVGSYRDSRPVTFLGSTDKPVKADLIQRVMHHNIGVLRLRGKELREAAGIAIHDSVSKMTPNAAGTMEITMQEDKSGSAPHEDGDTPLNEGLRFADPQQAAARGGSRRKGR